MGHSGSRSAGVSRGLRWGGYTAAAALVLFHARLLIERIADLSLFDPAIVPRWLVTGLLVAGFAQLRQRKRSLVRSREAFALWTLVLLLHATIALVPAAPLPVAGEATLAWLCPLGLALWLVGSTAFRRAGAAGLRRLRDLPVPRASLFAEGALLALALRGPPVLD